MSDALHDEAEAFDQRALERIENGLIPDLRRVQPVDWFFNNPWRRPAYANRVFGAFLEFARINLPSPPARIVEVCCGMGHMALELGRNGYDVTGIELSRSSVEVAERTLAANPFRDGFGSVQYHCSDLFDYRTDAPFDAAYCCLAMHHFVNPYHFVDHIVSLLQPRGRFVIVEPARDWMTESDAAIVVLMRTLLSAYGGWHTTVPLPQSQEELGNLISVTLREYQEARDPDEAPQSPHDNAANASEMLEALRSRFVEIDYQPGFAFLPRMIGGVRADTEPHTQEVADFLGIFDEFAIRHGLMNPGHFYFAGERSS